jgi:ketosteroid isomerase-like protein
MRQLARYTTLAILGLTLMSSSTNAQQNKKAEAEVDKAVHEIVAAYGGGPATLEKYFSYYSDDMTVFRGATGRWSKQGYYATWTDLNQKGRGVTSADIKDLQIQVSPSGDAAVTTYLMPVTQRFPGGVVPQGTDPNITWVMSETWFKLSGKWIVTSLTYIRWNPDQPASAVAAPPK